MFSWVFVIVASAGIPLAVVWRANLGWTIRHALAWTWIAWLAWLGLAWNQNPVTTYAALTFSAAALVAVSGARRPVVVAWNFVVAALLAVLWLGWAEGLIRGSGLQLGTVRLAFVGVLLAAGVLEYVATRNGLPAIMLGVACAWLLWCLLSGSDLRTGPIFLAGAAPWSALLVSWRKRSGASGAWLDFRDRYGFFWAHLTREQFNAAARNNHWTVRLHWTGFTQLTADEEESRAALNALLKRFIVSKTN